MKIALFITVTPFVVGGSELLTNDLKRQLELRGHTAKLFRIPFIMEFETGMFVNAMSAQMLNFDDYDILIAFKWPAYLAVHRHKNLWMFHQFRQAYDLFGKPYGLPDTDMGRAIKEMVEQTDNVAFPQANKIFAIPNSVKRLRYYSGFEAEKMLCPLPNVDNYFKQNVGDFIYCPSRIDGMKRQLLAVETMRYVTSGAKLIIDGKCGDLAILTEMGAVIKKYGLEEKVTIHAEFVPEEDKIKRYSECLAGIYLPVDEDSPGFVTLEAFYSRKLIITANDSGGVADYVEDGYDAFVIKPNPKDIAEKIDYLYEHKDVAEQMGENAYKYMIGQNLNWDETTRRLLG
ncbi:MAG: glycosyltransferase family 4 protein [Clostridiales bacterium]|jgi:glycosyltransferase involved in cell wall biosynthesis|nr:glycosyltransferase family 4 protein [Clostridiales bacterium]